MSNNKKRHHVVPVTYLNGFIDSAGKLYEYRKDDPTKPNYNVPREIGHRRYYYSQPKLDGSRDNNNLEDVFATVESEWPSLLNKICSKKKLLPKDRDLLFQFVGMLRVRVPAARDAVEYYLAELVKTTGKQLDKRDLLPPKPPVLEDIDLWKEMPVSIDPHKSIQAMKDMLDGIAWVLNSMSFKIFKNRTLIPFITSDNPVVYFDPNTPEKDICPYESNGKRIELIFPLDNQFILHGHSDYRENNICDSIVYESLNNIKVVKRFNRLICKFGYEKIFACNQEYEPLIKKHSSLSPVLKLEKTSENDKLPNSAGYIFGKRSKLPKW